MENTKRNAWDRYCRGLTELRTILEDEALREALQTEPEIGPMYGNGIRARWYFWLSSQPTDPEALASWEADSESIKNRMITIARLLPGKVTKRYYDDSFVLEAASGDVKISVSCSRESVCDRKVVGTKRVDGYTVPARDVEIVEWDCHPLLAPDKGK